MFAPVKSKFRNVKLVSSTHQQDQDLRPYHSYWQIIFLIHKISVLPNCLLQLIPVFVFTLLHCHYTFRSEVRIPLEARDFSLLQNFHNGTGARPDSYLMGTFFFCRGIKMAEREVNHSTPSAIEGYESVELCLYSDYMPPWGWHEQLYLSSPFITLSLQLRKLRNHRAVSN